MARKSRPQARPTTGIQLDRETGDWAVYLDGDCLGYRASPLAAQELLDEQRCRRAELAGRQGQ